MTLESLEFELPRRPVLFKSTTEMPDQSLLGYTGDPNSAVNGNTPGETLLQNSPAGTSFQDRTAVPYIIWDKLEDGIGGVWLERGTGSGSGSGETNVLTINEVAHTKVIGDWVTGDGSISNTTTTQLAETIGVVYAIDTDSYDIITGGHWTIGGLVGALGELLYLSDTGDLSVVPDTNNHKELGVRTNTGMLIERQMTISEGQAADDFFVKVSPTDTSTGYLQDKLQAGTGIEILQQNPSGIESLLINGTATPVIHGDGPPNAGTPHDSNPQLYIDRTTHPDGYIIWAWIDEDPDLVWKPISSTWKVKSILDIVTFTDDLIWDINDTMTDMVGLSDLVAMLLSRGIDENLTVSDVFEIVLGKTYEENLTVSDVVEIVVSLGAIQDNLTITDDLTIDYSKTILDSVTCIDGVDTSTGSGNLSTVNILDNIDFTLGKTFTDIATTSDEINTHATKVFSDSVVTSDLMTAVITRGLFDTVTVSDLFSAGSSRPVIDTFTVSDQINTNPEKITQDSITMSDAVDAGTGSGNSDSVTLVDLLSFGFGKTFTDSVVVTDQLELELTKPLVDSLTISDSISRESGKEVSSIVTVTDLINGVPTKNILDTVTSTDIIDTTSGGQNSDTVGAIDSVAVLVSKTFTESLTLSENIIIALNQGGALNSTQLNTKPLNG